MEKYAEIRLAVGIGRNQLAVDDAGPRRQREDSRGDRRKPAREIAAFRLKIAAT
jgi:hypothetical protein